MLANIANTFANCFRIPELKSRIIFTLVVLAICRITAMIPVPGLDGAALADFFERTSRKEEGGGLLGMYSMFTGGALERCAVGALGIMPYISATIILQLLTAVVPQLSKLAREEGGRAKIVQYGRYLTVLLCLGQGLFMAIGWEHAEKVFQGFSGDLLTESMRSTVWWYRLQTVMVLTTGTLLLMWLGEQISERGIGNGISLVITIGILARLPSAMLGLGDMFRGASGVPARFNLFHAIVMVGLLFFVIGGVIAVLQAQRKVAIQHAQRAIGRKIVPAGTSYMPLRVNYAGVMPIIFAQAILMFPQKILKFAGDSLNKPLLSRMANALVEDAFVYMALYGAMILFFSYFWVATQFNEIQIADDLKKQGGYIPGVRPGQATSDYLHNAMSRITLAGAVFLTIIATIPNLLNRWIGVPFQVATFFGGTSILILVGVMLDTMRQMESHLLMRHYDGFLKKGRMRGR